ncbi:MAG: sulfatase-like hydrolase/transferase [Candidatus Aminicenantes bacterium]|nr:sulfatase-like hydrolase/transferase [Candidatus Aminicenantes bacterium]
MSRKNKKKKKNPGRKVGPEKKENIERNHDKSIEKNKKFSNINSDSLKRYFSFIGITLVILIILYLIFWPKISVSFKKKQLKDLNIILITLDTLRADFVSAYEKGKAETPNMDRVAKEGVLFETCISQTPLTLPSHTSILSGTYPLYHQVRDNGGFLVPDSLEFVSEILQTQGFVTSAFIASSVLHSKWGINQGFDFYSDEFDLSKYKKISLGNVQK